MEDSLLSDEPEHGLERLELLEERRLLSELADDREDFEDADDRDEVEDSEDSADEEDAEEPPPSDDQELHELLSSTPSSMEALRDFAPATLTPATRPAVLAACMFILIGWDGFCVLTT